MIPKCATSRLDIEYSRCVVLCDRHRSSMPLRDEFRVCRAEAGGAALDLDDVRLLGNTSVSSRAHPFFHGPAQDLCGSCFLF